MDEQTTWIAVGFVAVLGTVMVAPMPVAAVVVLVVAAVAMAWAALVSVGLLPVPSGLARLVAGERDHDEALREWRTQQDAHLCDGPCCGPCRNHLEQLVEPVRLPHRSGKLARRDAFERIAELLRGDHEGGAAGTHDLA
jgi:hypothetical protein